MYKWMLYLFLLALISSLSFAMVVPYGINQLNVKNRVGNVLITFSNSSEYSITSTVVSSQTSKESGTATIKYPINISTKDGVATVETTVPDDMNLLDLLTVSIPASSPLKVLTASSEIGNITFSNILKNSVQIVLFNANMGDISIQNNSQAAIKSMTVLNGMGKVTIQNFPENAELKIEDDMGNVVLQNMPSRFQLEVQEKMGEIFYLGDISNVIATVKQGEVYINGKSISGSRYINNSGSSALIRKNITNDMGDINLKTN